MPRSTGGALSVAKLRGRLGTFTVWQLFVFPSRCWQLSGWNSGRSRRWYYNWGSRWSIPTSYWETEENFVVFSMTRIPSPLRSSIIRRHTLRICDPFPWAVVECQTIKLLPLRKRYRLWEPSTEQQVGWPHKLVQICVFKLPSVSKLSQNRQYGTLMQANQLVHRAKQYSHVTITVRDIPWDDIGICFQWTALVVQCLVLVQYLVVGRFAFACHWSVCLHISWKLAVARPSHQSPTARHEARIGKGVMREATSVWFYLVPWEVKVAEGKVSVAGRGHRSQRIEMFQSS